MRKVARWILNLHRSFLLGFVTNFPGEFGYSIRRRYWKSRLRHLGADVRFDVGILIQNPQYVSIANNCWIDRHVTILAGSDWSSREKRKVRNALYPGEPGAVHIGRNVHVGAHSIISGISAGVYISDDCCCAAMCRIYAFSHNHRSPFDLRKKVNFGARVEEARQSMIDGPVFLGENTGLALGVTLLPGAAIGADSFVKINSVVPGAEFPSNSVIQGDPAKRVGDRFLT